MTKSEIISKDAHGNGVLLDIRQPEGWIETVAQCEICGQPMERLVADGEYGYTSYWCKKDGTACVYNSDRRKEPFDWYFVGVEEDKK
jgi:hypothetical protein